MKTKFWLILLFLSSCGNLFEYDHVRMIAGLYEGSNIIRYSPDNNQYLVFHDSNYFIFTGPAGGGHIVPETYDVAGFCLDSRVDGDQVHCDGGGRGNINVNDGSKEWEKFRMLVENIPGCTVISFHGGLQFVVKELSGKYYKYSMGSIKESDLEHNELSDYGMLLTRLCENARLDFEESHRLIDAPLRCDGGKYSEQNN